MSISSPMFSPGQTQAKPAPWHIAITVNLKDVVEWGQDAPPDAGAEFDRHDTVVAIAQALANDGHVVNVCLADHTLPQTLLQLRPDFVFNIAEGIGGDAREAQVPALCELLSIPYTASRVLANAISLDKTQTKRIWQSFGLPTPRFQEFFTSEQILDDRLRFPLFVKPAREGTGMGMGENSIVYNEAELREQIAWVLATYRQPALVEEFLAGREFTVGFIGNPGLSLNRRRPELYNEDGYHFFPVLEIDASRSVTPTVYGHEAKSLELDEVGAPGYLCPADIPLSLRLRLMDLTQQAAAALNTCDVSRVDFRLDQNGQPYLLELNTLPGLNPSVSDLCIMAKAEGIDYDTLITEILYLAAERFDMPFGIAAETPAVSQMVAVSYMQPDL